MLKKFFCIVMFLSLIILPNICGATQIQSANYKGDFQFVYPEVKMSDRIIAGKINEKIREEVKEVFSAVREPDNSVTASMNYEIACDQNNILSIILTEYIYHKGAAHPSMFKRTLNFDTRSGKLIGFEDLKKVSPKYVKKEYSPKGITAKLKDYAKNNGFTLYRDFKELESFPENFYFDTDLHLHVIFQQYEVAPYAVGIIDLDTDL